ncbi:MAG TPA: hypothetical protein VH062_35570 [Polyangiaceae bacterium]|jgi:hypothetical protein|nr:hypothetical protein [Polyangiaceae bacterium]
MNTLGEGDEIRAKGRATGRLVMVLGITLPLAIGAGILIGMVTFGSRAAAPALAASCAPTKPVPSASAAPPPTLDERAAAGDYKAIDELKAKSADARTPSETLALTEGRSHNKGAALEGFAKEIAKNGDLLKNHDQLQRLRDFLLDRETANQAAGVIVGLPGTLGPDLLFEATSSKTPKETAQLAEDLLASKDVHDKASPALAVTLDLQHATECEAFKALLPKVAEQGDRRSIPALIKLANKRGCGDKEQDDCYACLRDLDKDKKAIDLGDAITAAKKRSPPKP